MPQLGNNYINGDPEAVSEEELLRHFLLFGKTGSGKSTSLLNLLASWFESGHGGCLVDPHGDLAGELLATLPRNRVVDVVVIDVSDQDRAIAWNPLWKVPVERRPVVAQGLLASFRGVWRDSWGPRMEYILLNALRLLLDAEEESLLGLQRLLVDREYRLHLQKQCTDPIVERFWTHEFDAWDERFRREAIAPIQNKIGQFLGDPNIRAILGQSRSKLDLRISMDRRRILVVSLSKGLIGEGSAHLFGSLIVSSIYESALSRANLEESERVPFLLAVDEFQNLVTDRFASALAEARKYGLAIVLANQYLDQLIPELRSAVLGNVSSMLLFRMGGMDAQVFSNEFGGEVPLSQFIDLPDYHALFFSKGNGLIPTVRIIKALPPRRAPPSGASSDSVPSRSRERFGTDRREVDDKIDRWLSRRFRVK